MHNRDLWVDYARGIGIFLVVAGHVSRGVFNAGIEMNTELFKLTDSIIYSFHMPLFFFLSGLFVLPSFEKYGRNGLIAEKINSVFYPYVVWSLLQGLIEVALSRFTTAKTSIPEVLAFLWQPRAQFWFLYVLLLIFVIAAVLLRPHSKKYNGLFPLLAIPAWLAQIFFKLPFPLDFIANYAIFFFLGMRFNEIKHIFQQKSLLLTLVGLGSFLIFQYQFHIRLGLFYADKSLLTLPLALSGIL
ncbi:MAG: acyltransferase family protein, partial [Burkholderiales bacterium]|nr:acyltransferase family protein [Burkholderiales bacterium]